MLLLHRPVALQLVQRSQPRCLPGADRSGKGRARLGQLAPFAQPGTCSSVSAGQRSIAMAAAPDRAGAADAPPPRKQWGDTDVCSGDGRESRLLKYVLDNAAQRDAASVLAAIDGFAYGTEWLMNVGDVKGSILDAEVARVVAAGGTAFMELGSYCGYSSVRIAAQLPQGAKLYCVEVSSEFARITRAVQHHAGVSDRTEVLVGDCAAAVATLQARGAPPIDLLFIDHLKSLYVPDFVRLREAGLLAKGSSVVADNLLYPGAPDFIELMESSPEEYDWTPHATKLEYALADRDDLVGVAIMKT